MNSLYNIVDQNLKERTHLLNQNDTRNFTGIQDKNIIFDTPATEMTTINGRKALIIHAKLTYQPKAFQKCGTINENDQVIKNGTQTSKIKLCNDYHSARYLQLRKQRFYCKACQETFVAETHLVNRHCFISNSVKADIVSEATRAIAIKDIAERLGVSWHTTQRVVHGAAREAKPFAMALPAHLSFDEFKYKKGTLAFDYIDAETGRIHGILKGTTKRLIKDHFIARYSLKERHQVKTITVDMNARYITTIKELFTKAAIIIDGFHIVQLISRALNKTRIQIMNQLTHQSGDRKKYRRLKRYWRLFLKREQLICHTLYKPYRLFGMRTEQGILSEMLEYNQQFLATYTLYQSLLKAFHDNDYQAFSQLIHTDDANLSGYMQTSLKTL